MPRALAGDLDHVLELTRPLWEELRGNRIFITGGTGFFGCWLLETFTWANQKLDLRSQAFVLTRDPERFRIRAPHLASDPSVRLVAGDVRDFQYPDGEFTHIVHAATDSALVPNASEVIQTIVDGTERCLSFAAHARCRKLLFTSSGAVYGKQPNLITHIEETYPGAPDTLDPASAYGQAKRLAETLCALAATSHLEVKIARCFAFVGPYMNLDVHFAIGNFIRDRIRGVPIAVKGDGTAVRSYLYASDMAIWLWTLLFRAPSTRAYNVGSEVHVSIAELASAIAKSENPVLDVRIQGQPTFAAPTRYVPSTQRARQELALQQTVALADAVTKTRHWFTAGESDRHGSR